MASVSTESPTFLLNNMGCKYERRSWWSRALRLILVRRTFLVLLFLLATSIFFWLLGESQSSLTYLRDSPRRTKFSLDEMRGFALRRSLSADYRTAFLSKMDMTFERLLTDRKAKFDLNSHDVLVFLHIQKTAGTSFEKYLVRHLNIPHPCECSSSRKRCSCKRRPNANDTWLFSRYSTGWLCGLHADLTEMLISSCVEKMLDKKEGISERRYFYTTFLRDPVTRFISEYRHVKRGATWLASRHMCNGRAPTAEELPLCYDPRIGWEGVSMSEFLDCPFNLAFNRQTRMLADLTLVDCYDESRMEKEKRQQMMLESAKTNLRDMTFFGLKERMDDSQMIFEHFFSLSFSRALSEWSKSKSNDTLVTAEEMARIKEANHLDVQLYEYAVELFEERLEIVREAHTEEENTFPPVQREEKGEEEEGESEEEYKYDEVERVRRVQTQHAHLI